MDSEDRANLDGSGEDRVEFTEEDIMNKTERTLSELVFASEPVTVEEIVESVDADKEMATGLATTLLSAGYLLTDSTTPGLDDTARFFPDPLVGDAVEKSRTFHAADSRAEVEEAVQKHEEAIESLKDETGKDSFEEFNDAVLNQDGSLDDSRENHQRALKWLLTRKQLTTLQEVAETYSDLEGRYNSLTIEYNFERESRNPEEQDKTRLEVPEQPFH